MASFISKIIPSSQKIVTKRHTVKQILVVPPRHLYNIIIDVNSYSEFLPFCKTSQILRTSDCGTMFDASLQIGFGSSGSDGGNMFQEEYISRVTKKIQRMEEQQGSKNNNSLEWVVKAKSIRSTLFHGLNSSWRLTESKSGNNGGHHQHDEVPKLLEVDENTSSSIEYLHTKVEFEVEISVSNPLIAAALDGSLENVAKQQVAAFEKRCFDIQYKTTTD